MKEACLVPDGQDQNQRDNPCNDGVGAKNHRQTSVGNPSVGPIRRRKGLMASEEVSARRPLEGTLFQALLRLLQRADNSDYVNLKGLITVRPLCLVDVVDLFCLIQGLGHSPRGIKWISSRLRAGR